MNRSEVLSKAVDECLKELYIYVQPKVEWEDFLQQNKVYGEKYKLWEYYKKISNSKEKYVEEWTTLKEKYPTWENSSIDDCIGPRPIDFYYLDKEILKDICDSYVYAYQLDSQQNLLDTIETLKNYCKAPIVDKYIEGKGKPGDNDFEPGHRSYDHPDNLEKEINTYLDLKFPLMDPERAEDAEDFENKLNTTAKELQDKFFEFLDMAGKFYNWTRDLNTFNCSVYLGPSPNTNKEKVIENWKKYRNKDIEINEQQMKIDYYGEDELD